MDKISHKQLVDLIKSEEYKSITYLWYWNLGFSFARGLRPLNNDVDVLNFIEDISGFNVADVYVKHSVDNPIVKEEEIIALKKCNETDFAIGTESDDERINGVEVEFQNEEGVRVDANEIEVEVQNEGVGLEDEVNPQVHDGANVKGQMNDDVDFVPSGEDSYSDLEDSIESYEMDWKLYFQRN